MFFPHWAIDVILIYCEYSNKKFFVTINKINSIGQ